MCMAIHIFRPNYVSFLMIPYWWSQAFQLLPEYLQILENYSGLSAVQEMGRGIEVIVAFVPWFSVGLFRETKLLSTIKFDGVICISHFVCFIFYIYSDDGISALQAWLARTIRKLDNHLLGVCQTFSEESYLTVRIYLAINLYAFFGWLYFLLTFLNYILLTINSEL